MKGTRPLAFLFLLLVALLSTIEVKTASAVSAAQCKEERRLGLNACKLVVYGRPPSPECCLRIRVTDVECVCPAITPKVAALVNVNLNRAIRVIEGCGRRVPRHFKCGSITTP